ncbi:MAG: c-type cytochrome [Paracoccaceae bacterium]
MKTIGKLILALSLMPCAAIAQETGKAEGDPVAGGEIFGTYCAACHGMEALGDGPMSPVLTLQPPGLTKLQAEFDGTFPRGLVIARIDGRDPLVAHGSPMPVYGDFFEGKGVTIRGEDGIMIMTSQPIVDLIAWLESVQE